MPACPKKMGAGVISLNARPKTKTRRTETSARPGRGTVRFGSAPKAGTVTVTAQPEPQAPSEVYVASHRSAAVQVAATLPRWSGRRKGQADRQPEGTMRPLSSRAAICHLPEMPASGSPDAWTSEFQRRRLGRKLELGLPCRAVPCRDGSVSLCRQRGRSHRRLRRESDNTFSKPLSLMMSQPAIHRIEAAVWVSAASASLGRLADLKIVAFRQANALIELIKPNEEARKHPVG